MPLIALSVSILSFLLSIISLVVTFIQKRHQDRLASRKALTDVIAAIAAGNIEMSKLWTLPATPDVVALRRGLNSQRRYLATHGDMLIAEIPELVSDADHSLVADAFDAIGNIEKAETHWRHAVKRASGPLLRAVNLRGLAGFRFRLGRGQAAREAYREALASITDDDDRSRRERADTLVMWALAERDFGYADEAKSLREQAYVEARRTGGVENRTSILKYIETVWSESVVAAPEPAPEATS